MILYTWQRGTFGLHRFIVVAANSVEEARLMAVHHGQADPTETHEDWQPGGSYFEAVMGAPDFESDIPGPLVLDSY
jgi:hypothetical protein